jgi:outer membrane protein OmpA-like peptidoglycan-associated protein
MKLKGVSLLLLTGMFSLAGCSSPAPVGSAPPKLPEPEAAVEEKVVVGDVPLVLSASYEPEFFSPDGDGQNDELYVNLKVEGGDIASWTFDILQPDFSPRKGEVFKHFEGVGLPTESLVWDGRSDPREAQRRRNAQEGSEEPQTRMVTTGVQSATDYPYTFKITDSDGNESDPVQGVVHVDILVSKTDDGRLQIRVPSIVFRAGAADFNGLPDRTVRNNNFVISRIASSLNKFLDYEVSIEGHANPENAPGTKAREDEEKKESKKGSVSEKRAEVILKSLVQNGVDKSRMTAIGYGISKPVVTDFDNKDDAWQNRRVEFYLQK